MKYFKDGDQIVFTKDDFINLQESPAVFYPLDSEVVRTVLYGGVLSLPLGKLREINSRLLKGK